MAALLDRDFSEKSQEDAREIVALLKLEGVDPAVAAEVLDHASTVDIQELPAVIGESFDLMGNHLAVEGRPKSRCIHEKIMGTRARVALL